jgi:lysylphosphatidylglycerol synthetase-like protein (DUF2156 family)
MQPMDPRALCAGLCLLTSTVIASVAERPNIAWAPFVFLIGLAVLAIAALAHRGGRRLPLARLRGLTIVALVIVALSAVSAVEVGGLGVVDLVAMALVAASVLVIMSPRRSDARWVARTAA